MYNFQKNSINLTLFGETGDVSSEVGVKGDIAESHQKSVDISADPTAGDTSPSAQGERDTSDAEAKRLAEFERLIKEDYKDLYDKRVGETVRRRLKNVKDTEAKYNRIKPALDFLSKHYGTIPEDTDIRNEHSEENNSVPVSPTKTAEELRVLADDRVRSWVKDAGELKSVYPSFDMRQEMSDKRFTQLIKSGVDIRTAYEVLHKNEIIPAIMEYAKRNAEEKITNSILANGIRPSENGLSPGSPAIVKNDVSKLTRADRREIIRRVQRGEKIKF
ncbi:MAG: hypothetical protein IKT70_06535 [Clostridia bacterium]|nr:hypothetical protein [Clostridia bacterium]